MRHEVSFARRDVFFVQREVRSASTGVFFVTRPDALRSASVLAQRAHTDCSAEMGIR